MMRSFSLSHVVCRLNKRPSLYLVVGLFLMSLLFSACSGLFGGAASPTPTSSTQALNKIGWCAKPLMVFRDEGAFTPTPVATASATVTTTPSSTPTGTSTPSSTPTGTSTPAVTGTPTTGPGTPSTITDWSFVKENLGFTVYLPTTLPNGSCLVSAQATIHDPIFGGSFTIGYLLPDHTSLSISEAPLKSQNVSFQCNSTNIATPTATTSGTPTTVTPSPTQTPNQLCSGAKDTTNIVLSGPGTVNNLQQTFNNLQPNVTWIPASS